MRVSIRKQLLILFIPFLFGLWIISAFLNYTLISTISRESFDRDLINSADSVVGRLRIKGGKVVADLPPAAQAILKHDESDRLYYRVLSSDGKLISGDSDLPTPSKNLPVGVPQIITARVHGKNVRLTEVRTPIEELPGETVIVQFAETTNVRKLFQQKLLLSSAIPQLLFIVLGFLAVWYGIEKILTPLRLVQSQVTKRSPNDFSALSDAGTPEEVYPLVSALNRLFERVRDEMQAHQRFIANAAHQLRTPLAGLKTYTSIGCEMSEVDDLKHIVQEIDQGIDRSSRIVSQLLALARTDGENSAITRVKSYIDLNFLVSEIVSELVDNSIRKEISMTFEPSNSVPLVFGEQAGLRHLVVNLIENAIAYTPSQGKILVKLTNDSKVILSVSDTGCGIPVEEHAKVFERFYRVPGTRGIGSGLGLAIVKEVANSHYAEVSISANGGGGCSVLVSFPSISISETKGISAESKSESILKASSRT